MFFSVESNSLKCRQSTNCSLYYVRDRVWTRNANQTPEHAFSDSWSRAWVTGHRLGDRQKQSCRVGAKVPSRGLDKQIALCVPSSSRGRSKVAFPSAGSKHGRNLRTSHPVPHPCSQMESRTFEYYQHAGVCDNSWSFFYSSLRSSAVIWLRVWLPAELLGFTAQVCYLGKHGLTT